MAQAKPRLGNIPFPSLEPHKGDGMGMARRSGMEWYWCMG